MATASLEDVVSNADIELLYQKLPKNEKSRLVNYEDCIHGMHMQDGEYQKI